MKIRKLTEKDVEFTLTIEPEDLQIDGNCMASDDAADKAAADEIRAQLASGNDWAWCVVKVTATWMPKEDLTYEGFDTLGGCSYASEAEFKTPGGYFDDMKRSALENLNAKIAAHAATILPLVED